MPPQEKPIEFEPTLKNPVSVSELNAPAGAAGVPDGSSWTPVKVFAPLSAIVPSSSGADRVRDADKARGVMVTA